jgi:glycerol-3-phosphate dehydrogenase
MLYEMLASVEKNLRFNWIPACQIKERYPFINSKLLKGAFKYYEYKVSDNRLTVFINIFVK